MEASARKLLVMTARIEVDGLTFEVVRRLSGVRKVMLNRCHNPNTDNFKFYGARGVSVCDEWRSSSRSFFEWARDSGYADGLEIDRKDGDGPYSPENCRWVTHRDNSRNRRNKSNSLSGFKGVHRNHSSGKPWHARLHIDGKSKHIGYFNTEEEAAHAYDRAALEHFGEFARLNFPQSSSSN